MKWELTADQRELVEIIREYRYRVVSAEEFAVAITEAGFSRRRSEKEANDASNA